MSLATVIDVLENDLFFKYPIILEILLKDRTTENNIIWATSDYEIYGVDYYPKSEIKVNSITGHNTRIIQPRITKAQHNQQMRTKYKAEVFTPAWVCNKQNNLVDNAWFGLENIFNIEQEKGWLTSKEIIPFPTYDGKTWEDYILANRMEITCGEAPYLTSRYDMVTGKAIDVSDRIGMLDRKLRVINERIDDINEWFKWVVYAYQSTYGYEFQGDNVILARENLFYTFLENYDYKFNDVPNMEQLKIIADIISWNIWQMDGLTYAVPLLEHDSYNKQLTVEDFLEGIRLKKEKIYCKIKNWKTNNIFLFKSIFGEYYE